MFERQGALVDQQAKQLNAKVGIGGGPTRATTLPEDAASRKQFPVASGLMDYFPDALAAIANISYRGNQQHHPGEPLHWDRSKSTDEADTAMRHFLQRGTLDTDGARHTAKAAWRILALLQKEIESEQKDVPDLTPECYFTPELLAVARANTQLSPSTLRKINNPVVAYINEDSYPDGYTGS